MNQEINPSLVAEWRALSADPEAAIAFYFARILPTVLDRLEKDPDHIRLRERGCSTLISTMGLSPETTVIAASVFRPERLVIIASEANKASLNAAAGFLVTQKIMDFGSIRIEDVAPTDAKGIYETVRRHLLPDADRTPIMDVTGGKKLMSATAAVAAWEARVPLCYVEGDYDRVTRRPIPNSERIILVSNPSKWYAGMLRDRALEWYERGVMLTAIEAFRESRDAQVENSHFDELAMELARSQSALMNLDFKVLRSQVVKLEEFARRPHMKEVADRLPLAPHVGALQRVADGESLALLATFRQLAARYVLQGRFDFASLLVYRSLEELVRVGLCRASMSKTFDLSAPNFALLTDDVEAFIGRYTSTWDSIGDKVEFPDQLTFLAGLTVLGTCTALVEGMPNAADLVGLLRHARNLASMRNSSVLAHGTANLSASDVERLQSFERDLTRAVLRDDAAQVDRFERDLAVPALRSFLAR